MRAVRETGADGVFARIVGDHGDAAHAFAVQLMGDLRHAQAAVHRLAAGHRHRVVVEDLVGRVDAGGDGGADRQQAGMEIGAVADIDEDMFLVGERRLADPRDSLAAHVAVARGVAVHGLREEVAADAGEGAAAFGHAGRTVVRAAGAEIGRAHHVRRCRRARRGVGETGEAVRQTRSAARRETAAEDLGDALRRQFARRREQARAVSVALADHRRRAGRAVENGLDLVLDQTALLFDHDDLLETVGEAAEPLRLQRPGERDLVETQTQRFRHVAVDAEVVERLHDVEERLARGDDAEARLRGAPHHAVEAVAPRIGADGLEFRLVKALLGLETVVGPADVKTVRRRGRFFRQGGLHAVGRDRDGRRGVDDGGDAFEADPQPGMARGGDPVQAEIEELLHPGGVKHRDHRVDHRVIALMRQGGGLGAVIVSQQHENAAVARRAGAVGVTDGVAAAVDAGALAVPDADDAVVLRGAEHAELLRAPDGGGGEVLVDARLEVNVVTGEEGPRLPQRAVVGAEGRAAIAGDEHAGLQPRRLVAPALEHGQADQRLGAGHEDSPRLQGVFVVEGDGGKAHRAFSVGAGPVGGGGASLRRAPRRLKAGSRAAGAPAPNRRAVRRARGSAARRGGPGRPPCAIPGRACIRR